MAGNKYKIANFDTCIFQSKICKNCPGRMIVAKTTPIPKYIGCPIPKAIFVLPIINLQKKSKTNTCNQIDALCKLFKEVYGYDLLEKCMITWAVRCPDFEYKDYSIDYCDKILYFIIKMTKCENVIFVGKWLSDMMISKLTKKFKDIIDINAYLLEYVSKDAYLNELKKLQL